MTTMNNHTPKPMATGLFDKLYAQLKEANPVAAGIIVAATTAFAALGLVTITGESLESRIPAVAYLILIGTGIYVITSIVQDAVLNRLIRWGVIGLLTMWCGAFVASRFTPDSPRLACAVYFWSPCRTVADNVAAVNAPSLQIPAVPRSAVAGSAPPVATAPSPAPVFMQFAGTYERDDVRAAMRQLVALGWNMQGVAGGGERTAAAAGFNEIRIREPTMQDAAAQLAIALGATGLTARNLKVIQSNSVSPGRLEIWVSR